MLNEDKQLLLATITPRGTDITPRQKYYRETIRNQQKELEKLNSFKQNKSKERMGDLREYIADFLKREGIDRFGVTKPNPQFFFRNSTINPTLNALVVFVVPMKYEEMKDVPSLQSATEILRAYAKTGEIVVKLTKFLHDLGYDAFGHHPLGNLNEYHHLLLPPHAAAAGLGEKGRTGLFIDHKYGPMVRLGAVQTNAPLNFDHPVDKGINAFCHRCRYCSKYCPPRAIDTTKYIHQLAEGQLVDFKVNGEKCIRYFEKHFACGKCLFHCVLAKPSLEEIKKRVDRIETWYYRWVKNGPPEEWKEIVVPRVS
ncbi:MAG: hypothetical protein D6732_26385 [Methanobacteriota archaeon]|nr:MAG: hypothetical protein D6732_26385 [Euryarchaeota archaeon]